MPSRYWVRFLPAISFMALIFWFSSMSGDEVMRVADPLFKHASQANLAGKPVSIPWLKIGHFFGYAGLGASLLFGLSGKNRHPIPATLATALLYALTDEFHQVFTPGRHAELNDVAIDIGAAGLAIIVIELVRRAGQHTLFISSDMGDS